MSICATREEIEIYLGNVPGAKSSWVDVLYGARLPMVALDAFIQRMSIEAGSPLRRSEDESLSKEIVQLNGVLGDALSGKIGGLPVVRVAGVLSPSERMRVTAVTRNFCQVNIVTNGRFGSNGHVVMNAARRAAAGYNFGRLPPGATVAEIGPDVKNWVVSRDGRDSYEKKGGTYIGSRPLLSQRDVVRVSWEVVAERIVANKGGLFSEEVVDRAGRLLKSYDDIFPNKKIQDMVFRAEFIISNDSNYDINFADMPAVMVSCGARAWYGTMLRVKGLSAVIGQTSGVLDLLGVTYRVDWKKDRIDFRHPRCNAFGYSHRVSELVKYEELNGYVWSTSAAHFVYSKGAETNDELLFFSVVRVPMALYMVQPNYVAHPDAGNIMIESIWAVGGWSSGVPTKFEPVKYMVEPQAFGRILEKRRALDVKGDFGATLTLVRSTNVRMWLNGTPVGTNKRIEASLAEATAVAIEAIVSQGRRLDELVFSKAMTEYMIGVQKGGWLYSALEKIMDLRAVVGTVTGPVTRAWGSLRGGLADMALSSLSDIKVKIAVVPPHVRIQDTGSPDYLGAKVEQQPPERSGCVCPEPCVKCDSIADEAAGVSVEETDGKAKVDSVSGDDSGYSSGGVDASVDEDVVSEVSSMLDSVSVADSVSTVECKNPREETPVFRKFVAEEWREPPPVVAVEGHEDENWLDERFATMFERKAMEETVMIEEYIARAVLSEVRVDCERIFTARCQNTKDVLEECTTRTQHCLVRYQTQREVERMGADIPEYSAMYDHSSGRILRVRSRRGLHTANVKDGWYYTCNHLVVWNYSEIVSSIRYALSHGTVRNFMSFARVVLGVPGAGKTYMLMKTVAAMVRTGDKDFLVIAVTGRARDSAIKEGVAHGIDVELLKVRVLTLHQYLMHRRFPAKSVFVDEFAMAHMGQPIAAASIAAAEKLVFYGDGRQIPYDPFTRELEVKYSTLAGKVARNRIEWHPMSHRLRADACAAWLEFYPEIYPCDCHRAEEKFIPSMTWRKIGVASDLANVKGRVHTYTRAELDQVIEVLRPNEPKEVMEKMRNAGIVTVHKDQGSTHKDVTTVRVWADFDKNSSVHNPSLYNRPSYVLTDQTRHTGSYEYITTSCERDMVIRRVELSRNSARLRLVKERRGMGLSTLEDMLSERYHPDILSGRSEK